MFKVFRQFLSGCLIFSMFLFLMMACADDGEDQDTNDTDPPSQEQPNDPPEETEDPPEDDPLDDARSIDDTCIVWKPVSEGDGKLVILLTTNFGSPPVYILDSEGNEVEQGRYVGRTNGNRATYRFNRQGAGYPDPCYLKFGSYLFKVMNPGARHSC